MRAFCRPMREAQRANAALDRSRVDLAALLRDGEAVLARPDEGVAALFSPDTQLRFLYFV